MALLRWIAAESLIIGTGVVAKSGCGLGARRVLYTITISKTTNNAITILIPLLFIFNTLYQIYLKRNNPKWRIFSFDLVFSSYD
jgi:uncharacterized membrane protein (GlpM family)